MNQERNGSLNRWLLGIVASALLLAAGWGVMGVKDTAEAAQTLAVATSARAAVLESQNAGTDKRLDRIDNKLDKIWEKVK